MNKNSFLEKSRNSKIDEAIEYAEDKGRKIGFIIFSFIYLFIILFNLFFSKFSNTVFHATSTMFWVFIASDAFQKFKFTRKNIYLINTIFSTIATIIFLVNFIIKSI